MGCINACGSVVNAGGAQWAGKSYEEYLAEYLQNNSIEFEDGRKITVIKTK